MAFVRQIDKTESNLIAATWHLFDQLRVLLLTTQTHIGLGYNTTRSNSNRFACTCSFSPQSVVLFQVKWLQIQVTGSNLDLVITLQ